MGHILKYKKKKKISKRERAGIFIPALSLFTSPSAKSVPNIC